MPSGERPTLLYIAGFVVPAKAGTQELPLSRQTGPGQARGDECDWTNDSLQWGLLARSFYLAAGPPGLCPGTVAQKVRARFGRVW